MFKRVDYIPEELRALLPQNKKAVVVIGRHAYEMYPLPLTILPEILNEVLKIYENARKYVKKQQEPEIKENFSRLLKELSTLKSILINTVQKNELDETVLEEVNTTLNITLNGLSGVIASIDITPIDIVGAPGNKELIIPLLKKILSEIPEEDFNEITPQQLVYLVNKAIEINAVNFDEMTSEKKKDSQEVKEKEPFPSMDKESNPKSS